MINSYRVEFLEAITMLQELGYNLVGTHGTAEFFRLHNIQIVTLEKPPEEGENSVITWIKTRQIDLVINIVDGSTKNKSAVEEITSGYLMRRAAVDFGVGLITNIK